jgi:hypothetical protein
MSKALLLQKGSAASCALACCGKCSVAATELSVHTSRMIIAVRRASLLLDLFCTFAHNACKGRNKSGAKELEKCPEIAEEYG